MNHNIKSKRGQAATPVLQLAFAMCVAFMFIGICVSSATTAQAQSAPAPASPAAASTTTGPVTLHLTVPVSVPVTIVVTSPGATPSVSVAAPTTSASTAATKSTTPPTPLQRIVNMEAELGSLKTDVSAMTTNLATTTATLGNTDGQLKAVYAAEVVRKLVSEGKPIDAATIKALSPKLIRAIPVETVVEDPRDVELRKLQEQLKSEKEAHQADRNKGAAALNRLMNATK